MESFEHLLRTIFAVLLDIVAFTRLCLRSTTAVAAENLFLRKQLGLFVERKIKPRRATDSIRFTLARLSHWFDWRNALIAVKPDTVIGWHRKGFRLFWKWKSRPRGRPQVPADVRKLIAEMAFDNPTWGEERIADELLLKIGIRVSPRTVRRYMPGTPQRPADPKQRWMTIVRNHANAIIASEFQKSRGEYQRRTGAEPWRTRDNVGTNAWRFRLILELVVDGFAGSNYFSPSPRKQGPERAETHLCLQ
jgi:hypothetical protein